MNLSQSFIKNIHATFKGEGIAWLERLAQAITDYESKWQIKIHEPFPNLSFNFVAPATLANGDKAVFKLGVASPEIASEIAALKVWAGKGSVKLLKSDTDKALLLERLKPGISFWHHDSDLAVQSCANLLLQLWQARPSAFEFRTLKSWSQALEAYHQTYSQDHSPLPWYLVDKAMQLRNELLQAHDVVLLHADLHHDNILSASRQAYLAIDPKGILGPRGYDVGSFLVNPETFYKHKDIEARLKRRLDIFSEQLGLAKDELAAWGLIHCMLSVCWSREANQFPDAPILVARVLNSFLP